MKRNDLSRRHFVTVATAALTGATGLTTATAGATGVEQGLASLLPSLWHGEADVVVIGFGAAGAAAAYEAAHAGASVIIIDASANGGGDTAISAGYIFMGGGTALQQAVGYRETPEEMYSVVRAMGGDGADPEVIRTWCNHGPELYSWLVNQIGIVYDISSLSFSGMEQHAEFRPLAPSGIPVPHCYWEVGATPQTGGAALFAKLSARALAAPGVRFKRGTKAVRLLQEPLSGRILGVVIRAVGADGQFVAGAPEQVIKASRAVVIATGGFSADPAMMARHNPNLLYYHHWSQANADGSGIRMGQRAGADLRLMKAWWSMVFFAAQPTTAKGILVSTQGSRFVAEDGTYYWIGYHMVARHQTVYSIFDQQVLGGAEPDPAAICADSIEELAEAINAQDDVGMAPELLRATVDGYNSLASYDGVSGLDPAFLKNPEFVVPLENPPFYAVKHTSAEAQGTTSGGLRVNSNSEVLSATGERIPGLFAAGTCCNLTMSERYTGSGTAIAGALVFGRIAGQHAAALPRWLK